MTAPRSELNDLVTQVPPPGAAGSDGFDAKEIIDGTEKAVDQIEMIGEEEAAGFRPGPIDTLPSAQTAGFSGIHAVGAASLEHSSAARDEALFHRFDAVACGSVEPRSRCPVGV